MQPINFLLKEILKEMTRNPSRYQHNCNDCQGICCILPKQETPEFPQEKNCNTKCIHLAETFRCKIHNTLNQEKFQSCINFSCHGAGQLVSRVFRRKMEFVNDSLQVKENMAHDFKILRIIHEIIAKFSTLQNTHQDLITTLKGISEEYELFGAQVLPDLEDTFLLIHNVKKSK